MQSRHFYFTCSNIVLQFHQLQLQRTLPQAFHTIAIKTTSNVVVQQVTVDPSSMRGPGPSSAIEPLVCLVAFTTRAIRAGEELTLHYGGKYQDRRDYPVGNASSVRCPKDLSQLFPAGVPWEAIAMIESDMLPEADSGSDEEWKPGMN